jgi:hypothetical protein
VVLPTPYRGLAVCRELPSIQKATSGSEEILSKQKVIRRAHVSSVQAVAVRPCLPAPSSNRLFQQPRLREGLQAVVVQPEAAGGPQAALQQVVAGRQPRQRPPQPARLLAEVAALLQPQARSTRWF